MSKFNEKSNTRRRELSDTELETVSGGRHPAKVTVPDLKLS